MKKLLIRVLSALSPAATAQAQTPQAIHAGFTVEREMGGAATQMVVHYQCPTTGQLFNRKLNKSKRS
jgi:hypothetical protein